MQQNPSHRSWEKVPVGQKAFDRVEREIREDGGRQLNE